MKFGHTNFKKYVNCCRMRWAGHVARMGEERGCIGPWWGNRGGKRPLGTPGRR